MFIDIGKKSECIACSGRGEITVNYDPCGRNDYDTCVNCKGAGKVFMKEPKRFKVKKTIQEKHQIELDDATLVGILKEAGIPIPSSGCIVSHQVDGLLLHWVVDEEQ